MTHVELSRLLAEASRHAFVFARQFAENDLPESFRYHVLLNQSFDGNASEGERVYPEYDGVEHSSVSADDAVNVLVRDGRCPAWIDVSVEAENASFTLIRLLCCGRYTDDPKRFYYTYQGTGPFGIKSPDLPSGYRENMRFMLPKI